MTPEPSYSEIHSDEWAHLNFSEPAVNEEGVDPQADTMNEMLLLDQRKQNLKIGLDKHIQAYVFQIGNIESRITELKTKYLIEMSIGT